MVDIPANASTTALVEGDPEFRTFSGEFETEGDHDWIKVDLIGGVIYEFFMCALERGTTPLGDAKVTLRDASGNILVNADDGGVVLNTFFEFAPAASGTYFLDVSDRNSSIGEYSLVVARDFGV